MLLLFAVALPALLIMALITEQVLRRTALCSCFPDGAFVSVDGHALHYLEAGEGSCTVVFESGIDLGGHLSWSGIQGTVSRHAHTISYDRAGILWSEPGESKSAESISGDLARLLELSGCPSPYILVGHSFAGLPLRRFVKDHADKVAGIVFVDVSHPEQSIMAESLLGISPEKPRTFVTRLLFLTGAYRLSRAAVYPELDDAFAVNEALRQIRHLSVDASMEEQEELNAICEELQDSINFGDIPLTVISADPEKVYGNIKEGELKRQLIDFRLYLQRSLCELSSRSTFVLAWGSGHYVHHAQPETVIEEILRLVEGL